MGCTKVELRRYRVDDLEAMFRLDVACFAPEVRFDRASMRAFAEERRAIAVVAETVAGELVGFVIVHVERCAMGLRGYLVTLDVAEQWRRKGIAQRLVRE